MLSPIHPVIKAAAFFSKDNIIVLMLTIQHNTIKTVWITCEISNLYSLCSGRHGRIRTDTHQILSLAALPIGVHALNQIPYSDRPSLTSTELRKFCLFGPFILLLILSSLSLYTGFPWISTSHIGAAHLGTLIL